jgi:hypothetical protein
MAYISFLICIPGYYVFEALDTRKRGILYNFNAFELLKEIYGPRFEQHGKQ